MSNYLCHFKRLCVSFGLSLLGLILNRQGKKILFLTSIYLELANKGLMQKKTLDRLNETLNLVNNVAALELPKKVAPAIWSGVDVGGILTDNVTICTDTHCVQYTDAERVCTNLVNKTPAWLKYDKNEMMLHGIHMLCTSPMTLCGTTTPQHH